MVTDAISEGSSVSGSWISNNKFTGRSVLNVSVAAGLETAYSGLRFALAQLAEAGADFTELAGRYPAEWKILSSSNPEAAEDLAAQTIFASERRLHRESEHTFRVLAAGAQALCLGSGQIGCAVEIRGAGRTDFGTLRGLVRAAEYARATRVGNIRIPAEDAILIQRPVTAPADFGAERARALRMLGLSISESDLRVAGTGGENDALNLVPPAVNDGLENDLYRRVLDTELDPATRIAAAVEYSRIAFYAGNWEGMAASAGVCLPLTEQLTESGLAAVLNVLAQSGQAGPEIQALEFEPALLRHPADVRAFLLKVLGIQATFRGLQDESVSYFRSMRATDGPLSPELRSQSYLYAALTLTKRKNSIGDAVAELTAGFEQLPPTSGESASIRRERGWLHNLRALTLVRLKDPVGALNHEKQAWACLEGLTDASAVHLRVNLISNISVLQENGHRYPAALTTWGRFGGTGFEGDAKFLKHYEYRLGGLHLANGHEDDARTGFERSLECCARLSDDFHEHEIAMELAELLLARDRDRTGAEELYERSIAAARRLGDPYRLAVAKTGLAIASGIKPRSDLGDLALGSITNVDRAEQLAKAIRSADADMACRALLPCTRTKLNRPFDLINL